MCRFMSRIDSRMRGRIVGDVMMEVDWSVGTILQRFATSNWIKKHRLSLPPTMGHGCYGDHAGQRALCEKAREPCLGVAVNPPLRGGLEPFLQEPDEEPAMTIDLLPTVTHLIDARLPDHPIDGKNITPLLMGTPGPKPA